MKFNINNSEWNIVELTSAETQKCFDTGKGGYVFGFSDYSNNTISLNIESTGILNTLKHELMHVWLWETGHNQSNMKCTNEDVCNLVAVSNDFINSVVNKYIQTKQKEMEKESIKMAKCKSKPKETKKPKKGGSKKC